MTISKQSFSSVIRQIAGVLSVVFGVLTASVSSLHLPVAVSTVLTVIGGAILAIEHYVSDPSTGTSPTTTTSSTTATPSGSTTTTTVTPGPAVAAGMSNSA